MKDAEQWLEEGDYCRTTLAIESKMTWSNHKKAFSKNQIRNIQQDARAELLDRIKELQIKLIEVAFKEMNTRKNLKLESKDCHWTNMKPLNPAEQKLLDYLCLVTISFEFRPMNTQVIQRIHNIRKSGMLEAAEIVANTSSSSWVGTGANLKRIPSKMENAITTAANEL